MYALGRSGRRAINIWPGFVDGLATLLLVVIFVLMVFMVAQYFLSTALTGKDQALLRLEQQIAELGDLLALERDANVELRLSVTQLSTELQSSLSARESLSAQLAALIEERDSIQRVLSEAEREANEASAGLTDSAAELEAAYKTIEVDKETIEAQLTELAILKSLRDEMDAKLAEMDALLAARDLTLEEREAALAKAEAQRRGLAARLLQAEGINSEQLELNAEATRKIDLLNRQILALRQQLAELDNLLAESEKQNQEQEVQIADLGKRLNLALATKVQELARYRSEFFGRLREVLGDQPGIQVVGDRFVFQSEVLFDTGSAELGPEGQAQMSQLADTLKEITARFPDDIDWILRVDGHTDRVPIFTAEFASNWELSTQRAISVVKHLVEQGIDPKRLAATGFGEFQPIDPGDDEIALRRNRRIELKLTQR
ncbi:MAG: peptidoglycan -binding protein [Pseudomonadota bacterium]